LPLGAAGPQGSPPITAVFVFTQTMHQVGPDASVDEILRAALATATAWGKEGDTRRLVVLADKVFPAQSQPAAAPNVPATAASTGVVATIYTHENPDGYAATKQECDNWLSAITSVTIFIQHDRKLSVVAKGDLYFVRPGETQFLDEAVPPLQYHILRHLLRNRTSTAQRELPSIIEACWPQSDQRDRDITALRRGVKRYTVGRTYDTAIYTLSRLLNAECGVLVRSRSRVYEPAPWPKYCVVDHH
jgi:hypothetical protein